MPRSFVVLKSLLLWAAASNCYAQNAELSRFAVKDEWTFVQQRAKPGRPVVSNEIRLSILFKKKSGDIIPGFVTAITDAGQVIWEPLAPLDATICVRDFVGRTDLGLPNSCKEELIVGKEWQSSSDDEDGGKEQIKFVVAGREAVDVPAGKFDAIKIRGTGKRVYVNKGADDITVTYWFAPRAKAMARAIREYRSADGTLFFTITEELTSVKVK